MDRGAWQATVHGIARVGHNLATKPPPPSLWQLGMDTAIGLSQFLEMSIIQS